MLLSSQSDKNFEKNFFQNFYRTEFKISFHLIRICYYDAMTNNFPGGIFIYVHEVELFDERPFEYEFFLRIEKSFPFMEELTLRNEKRQINKQFRKSKNLSIIKYLYRKRLNLIHSCID